MIKITAKGKTLMKRIVADPKICHGKPTVKGTRIMVWQILDLLSDGLTFNEIISDYFPQLNRADIRACVEYANRLVKNEEIRFAG